ncbi:MAG: hydroxymethylglutaryl-CoA reductase, degradative [Proteobacteria bacterium]|nr:hydroxymethylglutaryl-CoA reductase, degradative [Pseudomonadota bacterium]
MTSRIPGFHNLEIPERRERIEVATEDNPGRLPIELANQMIENVVGTYELPLGVVTNVRVNGVDRLVPVAVEEPSIVAAASFASKMVRAGGGFRAWADDPVMIAQVFLEDVADVDAARTAIEATADDIGAGVDRACAGLVARGGGWRGLEFRDLGDGLVVVHLLVDCRDAMGANIVNTIAEAVGERIAELAQGHLGMRILSNLADKRRVCVEATIPFEVLGGEAIARRIEAGDRFAHRDPYRATTHNKGIMNGIDAVLVACGQDWRGVEAGAHAYAARDGQYRSLTTWTVRDGALHGRLELPMAVGTVGGATRIHPGAKRSLAMLGVESATELAMVAAAVGLANNLSAVKALMTVGIQEGHMRLHERSVRAAAAAREAALEGGLA